MDLGSGSLVPVSVQSWILEQHRRGWGGAFLPCWGGAGRARSWKGRKQALELFAEFLLCLKLPPAQLLPADPSWDLLLLLPATSP